MNMKEEAEEDSKNENVNLHNKSVFVFENKNMVKKIQNNTKKPFK